MEDAIMTMVKTFDDEAKGRESLEWNKFHRLVKKHLAFLMTNVEDGEAMKRLMNKTDGSNVSFQEYLNLISALAQQMSEETLRLQRQDMEGAIKTVVGQFLTAARGKDSLDKKSFQKFLSKNLGNVLTNTGNETAVDKLIKRMDDNDDGKVSFQEYMGLIGAVAKAFSDSRVGQNSATN